MKARVLVCDDKENFTKLFRRILPEDRFDVVTAEDGSRALGLIAADEFDHFADLFFGQLITKGGHRQFAVGDLVVDFLLAFLCRRAES